MATHKRLVLLSALIVAAPLSLDAVIVRHDRDDAATRTLGERFAAAGRVVPDGGCTLIAPTWAVTAAHVAQRLKPGGTVEFNGRPYIIKRVVLHPESSAPPGVPPEVDLALLELATAVDGIAPALLYTDTRELGKPVFIVGYGDYGIAGQPFARTDQRRRAVTNVVDDAGPRRIFMRFDAPPAGSALEGVGGPGDSGGPAFIEENGRLFIAGVSSASTNGKPGTYGVTDVYTRISSYAGWIDQVRGVRGVGP